MQYPFDLAYETKTIVINKNKCYFHVFTHFFFFVVPLKFCISIPGKKAG